MSIRYGLKRMTREALVPLLYRYPPFVLAPERLYLYMHHLIQTKDVPGAVVEIGCNLGGTAVIAKRMLDRTRCQKDLCLYRYIRRLCQRAVRNRRGAGHTRQGSEPVRRQFPRAGVEDHAAARLRRCRSRARRRDAGSGRGTSGAMLGGSSRRRFDGTHLHRTPALLAAHGAGRVHSGGRLPGWRKLEGTLRLQRVLPREWLSRAIHVRDGDSHAIARPRARAEGPERRLAAAPRGWRARARR